MKKMTKAEQREIKKRIRPKVSGKSVFQLQRLIQTKKRSKNLRKKQ